MLQIIGTIGAVIILISMAIPSTHRKQNIAMRIINIIGSILLVWYSFQLNAYSNAFLNIVVTFINLYYIIKLTISLKRENKLLSDRSVTD